VLCETQFGLIHRLGHFAPLDFMIKILLFIDNGSKEVFVPALPRKGEMFRFTEIPNKDFIVSSVVFVGDGDVSFAVHVELESV